MSGAGEAVGVALAVLPLIIKAVESYEKIGDLVSTYRKYSKVVERFNIQLSTQKTIFRNECVLLLSDVGDDAKWRMHEIFSENRPATSIRPIFLTRDEHLWTDERIFERMNEREHDSYKQLAALLGLIGETLELISEETQRYRQEQLGDNASRPNRESTSFKAWAYDVRSKLRFLFEKTALKAKIDSLDHLNVKFIALSRQVGQFKGYQSVPEHQHNHELAAKGLEEVRRIRIASKGLCKALDSLWLCPDHSEHSANLQLRLGIDEGASTPPPTIQFSLMVTSWALDTYDGLKKPIELLVQSSLKKVSENMEDTTSEACEFRRRLLESIDGSHIEGFQNLKSPDKTIAADEQASKLTERPGENQSQLSDLCKSSAHLCRSFHNGSSSSTSTTTTSLGYLPGFLVYRNEPSRYFARATPLARLLSERNCQRGLNNLEKWKLATSLAMAVLQYHSTPWLQSEKWMDNGIMFFEDDATTEGIKSPESLHLQLLPQSSAADEDDTEEAISAFSHDPFIKNQTLFQLGMILLELEFEESLEGITKRWDKHVVSGTTQDCNNNGSWARRLIAPKFHAGDKLGPDYGRIVRMCLDCDFGLGLSDYSLDNDKLQEAFYLQIVCQFRKLLPSWEKIYSFPTLA